MRTSVCSSTARRPSCNRKKPFESFLVCSFCCFLMVVVFYSVLVFFPTIFKQLKNQNKTKSKTTKSQRICGLSMLWNIKNLTGPSCKLLNLTLNKVLRLILEQVTCRGLLQNELLHKTPWICDAKGIIWKLTLKVNIDMRKDLGKMHEWNIGYTVTSIFWLCFHSE